MPRKKDANGDSGKLVWEGANDTKLLILTQGRYVKPDEYEQLASALPGTTVGSIRNRISALRVKQRNMYEELGWVLPEGGAGHSAKKTKAKKAAPQTKGSLKRGASEGDDDDLPETPLKKPCAPRKKEDGRAERKDSMVEEEEETGLVKEEPEEEV
ncbi:hypothetical protein SVAN01_05105 [Stagonosporopsis vannaccii]|nr:hypothetical protein SVAN01_05105 [Stagonosporopsis vannaccii]